MDIGFCRAGFNVVWANELDKHACSTYRKNLSPDVLREGDLLDFSQEFPSQTDIDCVFGGPPCQGFSVAGKMDLNDERSQLVRHYMEVVRVTRPSIFVMENVKALATLEKFADVRRDLVKLAEESNYEASFHVLNARDFGVPQSRERMFFIGFKRSLNISFHRGFFEPYKTPPLTIRTLFSQIGEAGTSNNPLTCKAKITLAEKPVLRKSPYAGMIFNGQGRSLNLDGVSYTLPASMGGNKTPIIDDAALLRAEEDWIVGYHKHLMAGGLPWNMKDASSSLRRLTIREAGLIQTFPEEHKFAGPNSAIYKQIGNAVPCDLAFAVASAVRDAYTMKTAKHPKEALQLTLC